MNPFLAQIMLFAGNFAPRGWAFCHGQLLPISQNTALFSLLGTIYGGDGRTTFALPDLKGRVVIGPGRGPGLSTYREGQKGGAETVTLTQLNLAQHNHSLMIPTSTQAAGESQGFISAATIYAEDPTPGTNIQGAPAVTASSGHNNPLNNREPYLALNYIIALQGVFPSRS